jgi:hypothetical protein
MPYGCADDKGIVDNKLTLSIQKTIAKEGYYSYANMIMLGASYV